MSQKEVVRAQILGLLEEGKIDQQQAAVRMDVSARQVRRMVKRYRVEGLSGLINRLRGQPSKRRLAATVRETAMRLIGAHYRDFGPTLACEQLSERHGIALSVESARQLMIAEGYWRARKGAKVCVHPMRERRARIGELIQIDGSPHDWFEGRSAACTLLVFIDDASGKLMQLRFMPSETTLGYMRVLHDHVQTHGVPVALYSDKHSIFRINAKDAQPEAETQFARAARALGIESIHAHSPQAKGRVERANQTLQDRLVKAMRLAGIDDMDAANAWLPGFIASFNKRFAVTPKDPQDAHRPYSDTPQALRITLSLHTTRTLSKNLSCQHQGQLFQVQTQGTGLAMRGAQVTLHQHMDGSQEIRWRQRTLCYTVLTRAQRQTAAADSKAVNARVDQVLAKRSTAPKKVHKPAADHIWRKYHPKGNPAAEGKHPTP